jgi:hypothetical protein
MLTADPALGQDLGPYRLHCPPESPPGLAPCPPPWPPSIVPPVQPEPLAPVRPPATPAEPAAFDVGAPEVSPGGAFAARTVPIIGDFLGSAELRCVNVPRQVTVLQPQAVPQFIVVTDRNGATRTVQVGTTVVNVPVTVTQFDLECARVATAARAAGFKIAENENPHPEDRVFYNFNYFSDVNAAINRRLGNLVSEQDVLGQVVGFEKTLLDGRASVGLRVPVVTLDTASPVAGFGGEDTELGDLSVVFKAAPYLDPWTGNVFSVGMVVTAPTSTADTVFESTYLQPFVGYTWFLGANLYLQGFSAIAVPTDADDVTLLFNDLSLGYIIRPSDSGRLLTFVVPLFEVHVSTPLNHRDAFDILDPAGTPDWVTLTVGTTFGVGERCLLTLAAAAPVTGPRPFDYELILQYNFRF